ncbi:MAG: trypsin-like peptidase domain-containing protein [Gemmataceae bacterium]
MSQAARELWSGLSRRFIIGAGLSAGLCAGYVASAVSPMAAPVAADVPGILTAKRRDAFVEIVEKMKSAVVNIHSERTVSPTTMDDPFRTSPLQAQRVNGMGTGIILDPRGYVITNFHVVDDVQSLRVRLSDGRQSIARVMATDKKADLALLRIDAGGTSLPTVPLGTATDLLEAEQVIAIGNAFGYEHTVSIGNIAYRSRDVSVNKDINYTGLIQTTAPINPGNSGGPLFNKKGELIGVNVAIRAGAQNIAFAIPVDTMIDRAADMLSVRKRAGLKHGLVLKDRVERPTEESIARRWVTIEAMEADVNGLKPGDILQQVGTTDIISTIDVERALLELPVGSKIPVKARRGETSVDGVIVLQAAGPNVSAGMPSDVIQRRLGLKLTTISKEMVTRVDPQLHGGMMITDVANGSATAKAGLQRGDILIGFHLWEAINIDNVIYVLNHKDLANFTPVKTYFLREGRLRETYLTPGGD